jgi:3-oxoacyl-[acyl-carrier protein] reductase
LALPDRDDLEVAQEHALVKLAAAAARDNLILRMKEDEWDAVIDTNLKGAWNFLGAAQSSMRNTVM